MTLATVVIIIGALYFGREILIPVALAALLCFVLSPLVMRLRRFGLGRTPAVILVVLFTLVSLGGLAAVMGSQVVQLADNLPAYKDNIRAKIRSLQQASPSGGVIGRTASALQELGAEIQAPAAPATGTPGAAPGLPREPVPVRIEPAPGSALDILRDVAGPLIGPVGVAGLVIVFLVFMLLAAQDLRDRFIRLVGGRDMNVTTEALGEAAQRVSRYLLMQLLVNVSYGLPVGLGLYLIGVPNPLLWGLLAVVLRFVPYVGPFIAALFPIALAIAVDPGWTMVLWTAGLFITAELVSNNVVEPWLYGASTGLSPVAIILAAIFWTTLWGPAGLLLSTPLTVCLVVLGRYVPQLRFLYVLLGNAPALSPHERFYQRMLAGDVYEGEEMAGPFLLEHRVAAFHDDVVLPALRLAEDDRRREVLSIDRVEAVGANVQQVLAGLEQVEDPKLHGTGDLVPMDVYWPGAPVVCTGGRTPLDTAAAALLAQRLQWHGIPARVEPAGWTPERVGGLDAQGVEFVAVIYLGASGVAQARQLCRRLRRGCAARVLVGLFNGQLAGPVAEDQCAFLSADDVALSPAEALALVQAQAPHPEEQPMQAAPIPACEIERLGELERLQLLDTPPDPVLDAITDGLRKAFGMPIALVSLVDEKRQFWKSAAGLPAELAQKREAPRATSVCGHVVAGNEVLVVEDLARDPRFAANPFLREHGLRFYAGVPLRTPSGQAIGSLCVMDTRPRRITNAERMLLQLSAEQVMRHVLSARAAASGAAAPAAP